MSSSTLLGKRTRIEQSPLPELSLRGAGFSLATPGAPLLSPTASRLFNNVSSVTSSTSSFNNTTTSRSESMTSFSSSSTAGPVEPPQAPIIRSVLSRSSSSSSLTNSTPSSPTAPMPVESRALRQSLEAVVARKPNQGLFAATASSATTVSSAAPAVPDLDNDDCVVPGPAAKRARTVAPDPTNGALIGQAALHTTDLEHISFRVVTVLRQSIHLAIYSSHTMAHLKRLLAPVTGMDAERVVLVYENKELADNSTVAQAGIKRNAVLLARYARATYSVQAKTLTGSTQALTFTKSDTVGSLRSAIAQGAGLSSGKALRLVFGGATLSDDSVLLDDLSMLVARSNPESTNSLGLTAESGSASVSRGSDGVPTVMYLPQA